MGHHYKGQDEFLCWTENEVGVAIEGYLNGEKTFNRVLLLMREPNCDGNPSDDFWFRKVVNDKNKEFYNTLEGLEKKAYTSYKNCFNLCLEKLGGSKKKYKLSECIYINLHPEFGFASKSKEYDDVLKNFSKESDRWKLIEKIEPQYIITCKDIARKINSFCDVHEEKTNKFIITINETNCVVFGINHPCKYSKKEIKTFF